MGGEEDPICVVAAAKKKWVFAIEIWLREVCEVRSVCECGKRLQ